MLGFLLSDFILLVQPSKSITQFTFQRNTNVTYKIYKQPLLIHEIQVSKTPIEAIDNLTNADRIISIQQDGKQPVSLLTTSANECNLWVKRIEIAQEMHEKAISLTRTRLRSSEYKFCLVPTCFLFVLIVCVPEILVNVTKLC